MADDDRQARAHRAALPASMGSVESTDCGARVLVLEIAIEAALGQLARYTHGNWDSRFIEEAERILRRAMGDGR